MAAIPCFTRSRFTCDMAGQVSRFRSVQDCAAMSQENAEIVRSCMEAFDAGDYETALEAFAPDIEYDLSHFPDGGVSLGHDGVREAFRIWLGTWEDYRQERDELVDAGDEVIVPVREYGRGK